MESTWIQRLFYLSWTVIKLNLLFVLFSLAGGIIFGVGPALQMMTDFILEEGMNYQAITVKRAFESWKAHFKRSNCYFLLFLFTLGFVFYNIYLAVQFTGIMWLIITFILFFVSLILVIFYIYMLLYEGSYFISTIDLMKLSFISIFLNLGVFFKVLFGVISIVALTWKMKGLLLFASFALIMMWCAYVTRKNRQFIDGKLEQNEANLQKTV
ncbi:MAG: DUF624 domain-containing protein [Enterococcus faecalis]|nr:DUF624 domain-containing protein [Enterococcus faecalis]MDU3003384.1 DUF624 domain-containing protein [Enterococcus faecalis]